MSVSIKTVYILAIKVLDHVGGCLELELNLQLYMLASILAKHLVHL